MMINTHKALAQNFIRNVEKDKIFLISESNFIWGNLKPDSMSKYKFKKHYFEESFDMIVHKIQFLASLTIEDIYYRYTMKKFNQELGVICHFLTDYFCVPHFQRWGFKNANNMKEHILYENELNKFTKVYILKREINTKLTLKDIRNYILNLQEEYDGSISFEKDILYSSHICNTVINLILEEVILNQKLKESISLVI